MSRFQEAAYPEGHDYAAGSPHLKHARLRNRIEASLSLEVQRIRSHRGQCRVLEVGAGHGTFTAALRSAGAEVTVTEMSRPSADYLRRAFAADPGVTVVLDAEGDWVFGSTSRFDLVVAISVLHHIPDYLTAVARYAEITDAGGSFLSWQDPLWYPRLSRWTLAVSRLAYYFWRLGQGNLARGTATRIRRARGVLDETKAADMTEYHVVRRGVDEEAIVSLLRSRYSEASVTRYWSTQSALLQRLGDRLGLVATFSLLARGRLPQSAIAVDDEPVRSA